MITQLFSIQSFLFLSVVSCNEIVSSLVTKQKINNFHHILIQIQLRDWCFVHVISFLSTKHRPIQAGKKNIKATVTNQPLNRFGTMIWGFVINHCSSSPIFKSLDLSIMVITILVFEKEGVYLKSRIQHKILQ